MNGTVAFLAFALMVLAKGTSAKFKRSSNGFNGGVFKIHQHHSKNAENFSTKALAINVVLFPL